MFMVVEVDGIIRTQICVDNKPDKYGKAKLFTSWKQAYQWIRKRSYKGMSYKYEIVEVKEK